MKKAFIDQLFLGFILALGIFTFVATVNDERVVRDKIYDLKALSMQSSKALARYYEDNIDMCTAQEIVTDIMLETTLGKQISDDGLVSYQWRDSDGDGEPDKVTTTIAQLPHNTFWYRFLDKDDFTIGPFTWTEPVNTPKDVTISYGDIPSAYYENCMGTYQLDANNCVTNMQMYMANSKDTTRWMPGGVRQDIVTGITSPPTYIFMISNGNRNFNGPSDNAPISLDNQHCFGDTSYPTINLNGLSKSNWIFFEQMELNADGTEHMHIIPKSIIDDYKYYKDNIYTSNGNERDRYVAFMQYADALNVDADPSNDINYTTDPNDEYTYALEDLDANNSDFDFTDMLLNSTRVVIPNQLNDYSVNDDGSINLTCINNVPPTLVLGGCPATVYENSSISTITWTAADSDGTIIATESEATNGISTLNPDNTLTYTPIPDFFGEDVITVTTTDNSNASVSETCDVTVLEVNDPPVISGTALSTISAQSFYSFIPTSSDPEGDTLTFSISNKPAWGSFDTTTGELSGTPSSSDVGVYGNIVISVSDGNGGSAALISFNITVIKASSNNAPVLNIPIADQTVIEGNTYTYDVSVHFSDPDGDTLSYTVTGTTGAIDSTTGIISGVIPDGTAGMSQTITVIASDGDLSVSDTFILTIEANGECNGPFETRFDDNRHGWTGGNIDYDDEIYQINGDSRARRTYSFGMSCSNKDITLVYDYMTDATIRRDKLNLSINDEADLVLRKTRGNWNRGNTKTVQTDSAGNLKIEFKNTARDGWKKSRIDNILLSVQ